MCHLSFGAPKHASYVEAVPSGKSKNCDMASWGGFEWSHCDQMWLYTCIWFHYRFASVIGKNAYSVNTFLAQFSEEGNENDKHCEVTFFVSLSDEFLKERLFCHRVFTVMR